jgi:MFS family permease
MTRDSEDYKRGYKQASMGCLFGYFAHYLIVPIIIGPIVGVLWLVHLINPQFAERLWQSGREIQIFFWGIAVFAVVLAVALAVWKICTQKPDERKPFETIDKEREAEIFYGFRKPDETNL